MTRAVSETVKISDIEKKKLEYQEQIKFHQDKIKEWEALIAELDAVVTESKK